ENVKTRRALSLQVVAVVIQNARRRDAAANSFRPLQQFFDAIRFKPDVGIDEEQKFSAGNGRAAVRAATESIVSTGGNKNSIRPQDHFFPAKLVGTVRGGVVHDDDFQLVKNRLGSQR